MPDEPIAQDAPDGFHPGGMVIFTSGECIEGGEPSMRQPAQQLKQIS